MSRTFSQSNAKRLIMPIVTAATCLLGLQSVPVIAGTFRYNPLDGTRYTRTIKSTRITTNDLTTKKTNHVKEIKDIVTIKKTDKGFEESHKPILVNYIYEGKPVPATDLNFYKRRMLLNSAVTIFFDNRGRLDGAIGLKETMAKFAQEIGQDNLIVQRYMDKPDDAADVIYGTLFNRSNIFLTRSTDIGTTWSTKEEFIYDNGTTIKMDVKYKVAGRVKCNGKDCMKVTYSYTANPAERRDVAELTMEPEMIAKLKEDGQTATVVSASESAHGEIILDPDTLLFYHKSETSSTSVVYSIPSVGSLKSTAKEWEEWTYDYK